ncbi:MAG: metallophosphatase [Bacteroidetes bacterium]|nr:metallophosphatase [Bacteroidota bacterium]
MNGSAMPGRRNFLKTLAGSAALLGMGASPLELLAKQDIEKLTILHTNDVHSRIDPFPDNDPKYAGLGGTARRAALIKKIRAEEKNVLLLDSGDSFQGTPYFNMYGGELEFKLMSDMGYDASTIGNHDFDNGMDGLVKQLPNANFSLLCSNYDFSDTPLNNHTQPYKLFEKGGIRIGVFGIGIELQGLVDKKLYGNTVYNDPLSKARYYSHFLKEEKKCDLVICLSHLGYQYKEQKISDEIFAGESEHIDLILGGHTHTFLDEPVHFKNKNGKEILVAQVGWAGIKLGRIDYYFEKNSKKKDAVGTSLKISRKSSAI